MYHYKRNTSILFGFYTLLLKVAKVWSCGLKVLRLGLGIEGVIHTWNTKISTLDFWKAISIKSTHILFLKKYFVTKFLLSCAFLNKRYTFCLILHSRCFIHTIGYNFEQKVTIFSIAIRYGKNCMLQNCVSKSKKYQ